MLFEKGTIIMTFEEFIEYYEKNKEKIGRAVDKALKGDYTFETWK